MGNESSKGQKRGENSGTADDDGPVRIGGGGDGVTRDARSNSVTLDGHTPYHAPPLPTPTSSGTGTAPHVPGQSFDEDRHSDQNYAALDDGPVSIGGGGKGGRGSDSDGPVSIGGGRRGSASSARHSDIVQLNRAVSHDEADVAMMHPEVEALLSMAQFYPADPSYQQRVAAPPDALNITPVLVRPRAVMDVYSSLQQRWSGAGAHALRCQVLIGKEMDGLEQRVQAAMPAVHERNAQIRMLNEQLQQLPDLHASLQRQQIAVAKCVQTMQDLKSTHTAMRAAAIALLPAHLRLEDLDEMIEWNEAKEEDE